MTDLRSDARQHRRALLDAASAVFLAHGITAPLDLVVERAHVGRATLYRHFPDRAALVFALIDEALDRLEAAAAAVPPGQSTFYALIDQIADILAKDPSLVDFWRVVPVDSAERIVRVERLHDIIKIPMTDAIANGVLRPDFRADDVPLIAAMLGVVVREPDASMRHAISRRLFDLLMTGLRPSKPGPPT